MRSRISPRAEQSAKMKAIIAKMDRVVKEEVRGGEENESVEGALGEVNGRGRIAEGSGCCCCVGTLCVVHNERVGSVSD